MANGIISRNVIGIDIQTEDYDLFRLMTNVFFIDNQENMLGMMDFLITLGSSSARDSAGL